MVHIVNAATVAAVSDAAVREGGAPLRPSRFRANVVLAGLPAWEEFSWVGRTVELGEARLKVLSRTVRCEATNFDPWSPAAAPAASGTADDTADDTSARRPDGEEGEDVPGLIQRHFPEHGPYLGVYARRLTNRRTCDN